MQNSILSKYYMDYYIFINKKSSTGTLNPRIYWLIMMAI